jgi:hypothetical protein
VSLYCLDPGENDLKGQKRNSSGESDHYVDEIIDASATASTIRAEAAGADVGRHTPKPKLLVLRY